MKNKNNSGLTEAVVQSSRPRIEIARGETRKYVLTDGSEIFAHKFMTDQEAQDENYTALRNESTETDGAFILAIDRVIANDKTPTFTTK